MVTSQQKQPVTSQRTNVFLQRIRSNTSLTDLITPILDAKVTGGAAAVTKNQNGENGDNKTGNGDKPPVTVTNGATESDR